MKKDNALAADFYAKRLTNQMHHHGIIKLRLIVNIMKLMQLKNS